MELKRAAAPSGRQPAWPRRHRTTAKPGQRLRCTLPAASRRGPGAPAFWALITGQIRPKAGARHRPPFLQAVHSNARGPYLRARSVRGRARVVHRVWSSLRLPFRPMSSGGAGQLFVGSTSRQRSVQSCPKNGRMMEDHGITWRQRRGIPRGRGGCA